MTEYGRFTDANGLLDLLARRKAELGLSNAGLERLCDMEAPGLVDKYLGPSRVKTPNLFTLFMFLDALALSGSLYVDERKAAKRKADWEMEGRRYEPAVRPHERVSKALIRRTAPEVRRVWTSLAAHARWAKTTPAERKAISRGLHRAKRLRARTQR